MDAYCQEVRELEGKFWGLKLHHIPRKQNPDADALAKMAAECQSVPCGVFVGNLNMPSAREKPSVPDMAQAEETKRAEKAEHAPTDPAPDQTPGGPQCLATGQPDQGQADNTD